MPYGVLDLDLHWIWKRLYTDGTKPLPETLLTYIRVCGINLRAISRKMFQKICFKTTHLNLEPYFPWGSELNNAYPIPQYVTIFYLIFFFFFFFSNDIFYFPIRGPLHIYLCLVHLTRVTMWCCEIEIMNFLTHKRLETHVCVISTLATAALLLKYQAISSHSTD